MKNNKPVKMKKNSSDFFSPKEKKAQVQITFNWVYILIAGAIILLFFIGIVMKQKVSSEESLQKDIIKTLESIFVGGSVSEQTKNSVTSSGLSDYVLEFKCAEGSSTFGIKNSETIEVKLQPIFAPKEIKTSQILLWSLPYKMPYKVEDLLIVSSINTKYFVLGRSNPFWAELEKSVSFDQGEKTEFNFEFLDNPNEAEAGNNYQVRIIDLMGDQVGSGKTVPPGLINLDDSKVTAIVLSGKMIAYFQKEGNIWKPQGQPVTIRSLGEEKDAATYAALFSENGESYKCNMEKVFKRMILINKIYQGKLADLIEFYQKNLANPKIPRASECKTHLEVLKSQLIDLNTIVSPCISDYDFCGSLGSTVKQIRLLNTQLMNLGCAALY